MKNYILYIFLLFIASSAVLFADGNLSSLKATIVQGGKISEKSVNALILDDKIYLNNDAVKELFGYELKKVSSSLAIACTATSCFQFYFADEKKPVIEKDGVLFIDLLELALTIKFNVSTYDVKALSVKISDTEQVDTKDKTKSDDKSTSGSSSKQ